AVHDWCGLAAEVAAFVAGLHRLDAAGAPPAGPRGGPLAPHDGEVRRAVAGLAGLVDTGRAVAVWEDALAAGPWPGPPVWVHGDLLPGNVLARGGRLAGVVDWGAAGAGDPACDAMLAWSLPAGARAVFRAGAELDDAAWARARGWVVQQAALFIPYYARTIPAGVEAARRRLDAALAG
ncbi:MAG TPA: phosphotransferase, partial [Acidimicrobiales bacterium]